MKREGFAWVGLGVSLFVIFFLLKCQNDPPKKVEKVTTITKPIKESLDLHYPLLPPRVVYVERIKTIKGKDSIIYRDKPTNTTTKANLYKRTLKSKKATANLQITTTGDLFNVTGDIEYPETTIIKETTITVPKSTLFGSIQSDAQLKTFQAGFDLDVKNKFIFGAGVLKVEGISKPFYTFKAGVKIF